MFQDVLTPLAVRPESVGCLSHLAFMSENSKGRRRPEPSLEWPGYDEAKIMNSWAWSSAVMKMQVFTPQSKTISWMGDRLSTRWNHIFATMEIVRKLAENLGLNYGLASAIAAGHDVGQPPFAHTGERFIQQFVPEFCHENFGSIVLNEICRLNLCYEVLEGITFHSFSSGVMERMELPEEYRLVALADKLAYTMMDAWETKVLLSQGQWPKYLRLTGEEAKALHEELVELLQPFVPWAVEWHDWADALYPIIVDECAAAGHVQFNKSETAKRFWAIRDFMHEKIYPFVELERENRACKIALEFLEEAAPEWDPIVAFALMHDQQVFFLQDILETGGKNLIHYGWGQTTEEVLEYHEGWFPWIPRPGAFNIVTPNLSSWQRNS